MKYSLLIFCLFFSQLVVGKILVLEHQDFDTKAQHGEKVKSIACKDQSTLCILQHSESLVYLENYKMYDDRITSYDSKDFFEKININLQNTNIVNISIGFQSMRLSSRAKIKHENGLDLIASDIKKTTGDKKLELIELKKVHEKKYQDLIDQAEIFGPRVEGFGNLINNNPKHLFVIASGNGALLSSSSLVNVGGVGLSTDKGKYKVYPAMINTDNTLKVAAVDNNNSIAKYSNYSLEIVDVAANVEMSPLSREPLKGTSFAAPKVSRIASKILKTNPALTPKQTKEIIMKTCDIKNIQQAINASIDLKTNGKESKTYKSMYHRKRKLRVQLQNEIGSILLVKSGGTVNESRALACAQSYLNSKLSIEDTCLKTYSQSHNSNYAKKLKLLWEVRNF